LCDPLARASGLGRGLRPHEQPPSSETAIAAATLGELPAISSRLPLRRANGVGTVQLDGLQLDALPRRVASQPGGPLLRHPARAGWLRAFGLLEWLAAQAADNGLLRPFRDGITVKKRVLVAIATRTAGGLATRPGKGALDCSFRDGAPERKRVLVAVVTRTSSGLATRPGKRAPDCSSRDGVMWSTMIFVTIRHIGTFMPRDALYTQHARQTRPRHPQPAF
jgi:hypothetical protein